MIISRTPLRVSFCGGGTDLDGFARSEPNGGRVVSIAIDKYVYVTLNRRFDEKIRVSYSEIEKVGSVDEIQHALVREAMRLTGVESGIEITTIADIPGRGTGLGSSSTVTVGLLNALHNLQGRSPSKEQLAEEACRVEIDILGAPIGRQDQYAASFGGFNSIRFGSAGVEVEPILINENQSDEISSKFTLVYTGMTRSASKVLAAKSSSEENKLSKLRKIRDQADMAAEMVESGDLESLGVLLNDAWLTKRKTSPAVSNQEIDKLYQSIMSMGAKGAKLLGAGSGGFLLVFGESNFREIMESKLPRENRILPISIDFSGSEIIH